MKTFTNYHLTPENEYTARIYHPWFYRNKIQADPGWEEGQLLKLFVKDKQIGFGVYSLKGPVAIRVLYSDDSDFINLLKKRVFESLIKRVALLKYTDSIRLIHGENDLIPGITVDMHGSSFVISYYSPSLQKIARYISYLVYYDVRILDIFNIKPENVILVQPIRKGKDFSSSERNIRVLRSKELSTVNSFVEIYYKNISYKIDILGQKGGIYNDIRNLRKFIFDNQNLFKDKNILNLFSNNGLLSQCIENAGAKSVVSIEDSGTAIRVHKHNLKSETKQEIVKLDIFKKLKKFLTDRNEIFDCIIIDPPSLTASEKDKIIARKTYKQLIRIAVPYLKKSGLLILCSCSARIHENDFERICKDALTESKVIHRNPIRLKPEPDHPVIDSFPEGQYFKVHIYDLSRV